MRLLFVHGRAQGGKNADKIKQNWLKALDKGLKKSGATLPADLTVDFPYYGDLLDDFTERASLPMPKDVLSKGPGQNAEFENFARSVLQEMQANANIAEDEIRRRMDPKGPAEMGPQNWEWLQAIVKVIDDMFTPVSGFVIEQFLSDVFLYLSRKAVRKAIDDVVIAKLTGEPTVVVAHSLGSVVAYNVLAARNSGMDLRGFLTLGCPLGIRAISSKLGALENPAADPGWFNAYDERDIVALNPLDETYFPVDPHVGNRNDVDNWTKNRHSIDGYLDDAGVAAWIAARLA